MPALENEVLGVVSFVRPNCNPSRAGNLLQHDQRRIPFCRVTKGLDFSKEDRVDEDVYNRILWKGIMGRKPYPGDPKEDER